MKMGTVGPWFQDCYETLQSRTRGTGLAGRRENPLDPDGGPVGEFAADLRQLRSRAGLTYRRMAPLALASATSLADAASGKSLPTQSVTEGYVRACGGTEEDVRAWTARWHALREQLSLPAPPPEATAEPATRWLPWRRWVLAAIAAAIVVALSVTAVVAWD